MERVYVDGKHPRERGTSQRHNFLTVFFSREQRSGVGREMKKVYSSCRVRDFGTAFEVLVFSKKNKNENASF